MKIKIIWEWIKKHWKKLLLFLSGVIASIIAVVTLSAIRSKKQDKKKKEIIDELKEESEKIEDRSDEDEKIIDNSVDVLNDIADGK